MTDYRDGKIHGWNGGECPVHPNDGVRVWPRVGTPMVGLPTSFAWFHTTHDTTRRRDIIAFQVTKKHEEPLTFWVNIWPDGGAEAHTSKAEAEENSSVECARIAVKFQEVKE